MKLNQKHIPWILLIPWVLNFGNSDFISGPIYWGILGYLTYLLLTPYPPSWNKNLSKSVIIEALVFWVIAMGGAYLFYMSFYISSHPPAVPNYADAELVRKISTLSETRRELANEFGKLSNMLVIGYVGYLVIRIVTLIVKKNPKTLENKGVQVVVRSNWFWPLIDDELSAKKARRQGLIAGIAMAVISFLYIWLLSDSREGYNMVRYCDNYFRLFIFMSVGFLALSQFDLIANITGLGMLGYIIFTDFVHQTKDRSFEYLIRDLFNFNFLFEEAIYFFLFAMFLTAFRAVFFLCKQRSVTEQSRDLNPKPILSRIIFLVKWCIYIGIFVGAYLLISRLITTTTKDVGPKTTIAAMKFLGEICGIIVFIGLGVAVQEWIKVRRHFQFVTKLLIQSGILVFVLFQTFRSIDLVNVLIHQVTSIDSSETQRISVEKGEHGEDVIRMSKV